MRKQRAFATLTEAEINQIAEWLRHEKYEVVLERVNKPRPEGFGLDISIRPLQLLHEKSNRVTKINAHLEAGEKLTVTKLDAIIAGETFATQKAHNAIMEATHDLATSGDNSQQRLELAQQTFTFRQKQHQDRLTLAREKAQKEPAQPENSDHLGPLVTNLEDIGRRICKQFNISPEESARRAALRKTWPGNDPIYAQFLASQPDPINQPSHSQISAHDAAAPADPLEMGNHDLDTAPVT